MRPGRNARMNAIIAAARARAIHDAEVEESWRAELRRRREERCKYGGREPSRYLTEFDHAKERRSRDHAHLEVRR